MKNNIFLICALVLSGLANAQTNWKNNPVENKKQKTQIEVSQNNFVRPKSTNNILFSSDFSNPAQWSITSGIPGVSDNWVIRTTGPTGPFRIPTIASTTAANGFALFDSDTYCSGNLISNLTTASPINCANAAGVVLNFQQFYSRFADSTFVFVSTNNQTWTKFYVNRNLSNNDFSGPNPTITSLNISSVAANQPSVWIRFQYYSPSSMGAQAGCGYAWMIDDVTVEESPSNQININNAEILQAKTDNIFYGQTPCKQIDSLQFEFSLENFGVNAQNNVSIRADVFGPNSIPFFTGVSSRGAMLPQSTDTAVVNGWFVPSYYGGHSVQFSVSSDSILGFGPTNTRTRSFFISDTTYAVDNSSTVNLGVLSTASFTNAEDDFRMANYYQILDSTQVRSATVFLSRATRIGSGIQLNILDIAGGSFQTDFPVIISSDLHTITAADSVAGVVTLSFPAVDPFGIPQNLGIGVGEYYLSASLYSNNGINDIGILDDRSISRPWYAAMVYIPDPLDGGWFSNGDAFYIRLNVDGGGGCFTTNSSNLENATISHKLYPNPNQGFAAIQYELTKEASVQVLVRDITGKIVMHLNQGTQLSGKHTLELNTQNLANGIYIYELVGGTTKASGKMIVNK